MRLMRRAQRAAQRCAAGVALALLVGCAVQTRALREQPPADLPPRAELTATPFFAQTEYQCGPAALAMALAAAGLPGDPAELGPAVFLPARTGTLQIEMIAGARRQGAVATRVGASVEAALREVAAGHPVVVLQNLGLKWLPAWHYAVLVGYDLELGDVFLRSGATRREALAMRTFEHTWARSGFWGFVALPPGQWPSTAPEASVIEASVGFERSGTPREAASVYRSALARFPGSLTLSIGLGNSLYAAGDKHAAAEAFRGAALAHRSSAAWVNLSATLLELGDRAGAREAALAAQSLADPAWRTQVEEALERSRDRATPP